MAKTKEKNHKAIEHDYIRFFFFLMEFLCNSCFSHVYALQSNLSEMTEQKMKLNYCLPIANFLHIAPPVHQTYQTIQLVQILIF